MRGDAEPNDDLALLCAIFGATFDYAAAPGRSAKAQTSIPST